LNVLSSKANGSNQTGEPDQFPTHPASLKPQIPLRYNNTESYDSVLDAHNIIQLTAQIVTKSIARQWKRRSSKRIPNRACDSGTLVQRSELHICDSFRTIPLRLGSRGVYRQGNFSEFFG
jgi:hypothetical protein